MIFTFSHYSPSKASAFHERFNNSLEEAHRWPGYRYLLTENANDLSLSWILPISLFKDYKMLDITPLGTWINQVLIISDQEH